MISWRRHPSLVFIAWLLWMGTLTEARSGWAAPGLRYSVAQRGDIVVFGNTLGHDCRPVIPTPTVGSVDKDACGSNRDDNDIDVLWRADEPSPGQASAGTLITPDMARSTAMLKLPEGALTSYARIYWSATAPKGMVSPAAAIIVERPGLFTKTVRADTSGQIDIVASGTHYQQSADITSLVQLYGPGPYRVSKVVSVSPLNQADQIQYAAWSVVVFYTLKTEPPRSLSVLEGFDEITGAAGISTTLNGFLVPATGYDAKLAVVAYQGDPDATGDRISVNGTLFSDLLNPPSNFFNSTQSRFGQAVSNSGDLPQANGRPGSMSGLDIDLVDITSLVKAGDKSIAVAASTTNDSFFLGTLTGAVASLTAAFSDSLLDYQNLSNPGGSVRPSDKLQFAATVPNTGSDTSVDTYITIPLPVGLTYVPGSIRVVNGANSGPCTDRPGDDPAEYDPVTRTIKIRIGNNSTPTKGGSITVNDTPPLVQYQVTVDPAANGTDIMTSAVVTASGMVGSTQGVPPAIWNTGGIATPLDGPGRGVPVFYPNHPVTIPVRECRTGFDCPLAKPRCDVYFTRCTSSCNLDKDCEGAGIGQACTTAKICGCTKDSDCLSHRCDTAARECLLPDTDLLLAMQSYPEGGNQSIRLEFEIFNIGPSEAPAGISFSYMQKEGLIRNFDGIDRRWQCNNFGQIATCTSMSAIPVGYSLPLTIYSSSQASDASLVVSAGVRTIASVDPNLSNNSIDQIVHFDNRSASRDATYLDCSMKPCPQNAERNSLRIAVLAGLIALSAFAVTRARLARKS